MIKKKLLIYILLTFWAVPQFAQIKVSNQNSSNLAYSYYRNKEYDKAAPLFLELYQKNKSTSYFDYYINCLISLQEFDDAEKAVKKVLRTSKNPADKIMLGYVYKSKGDTKDAEKTFDAIIDNLPANTNSIITIANNFFNHGEYGYAEKSYLKGREIVPGEMFRTHLATVYAYQRDYTKMINEYLSMLGENEKSLQNVQGRLSSLMRYDFDNALRTLVKKETIRKIQSSPDILVYNRLLIWMLVQEENFAQALTQSVALDRRTLAEEGNILSFARNSANKGQYDVAMSGLEYLTKRNPKTKNIDDVKQELVRVNYLKLTTSSNASESDYLKMESVFKTFFDEYQYNTRTAPLARDYAHFLAFHRNKSEEAFTVLETALKSKNMDANQYTSLRIELADVNVYADYLWEASLQYSQIIDINKNNSFGDDVKLRRAKLSYYQGEIEWAKSQLDVLKASTSKLTANDAMDLSLLISDNYELDSIAEPLQMFAQADLLLFRNQTDKAVKMLDSLEKAFPGHTLGSAILMRKASIAENKSNYEQASEYYSKLVSDYSFSPFADDALFRLAEITGAKLGNEERAKELYKQILTTYPGSIYVADAREKFREIRGDFKVNDPFNLLDNEIESTLPEEK